MANEGRRTRLGITKCACMCVCLCYKLYVITAIKKKTMSQIRKDKNPTKKGNTSRIMEWHKIVLSFCWCCCCCGGEKHFVFLLFSSLGRKWSGIMGNDAENTHKHAQRECI